MVLAFLVAPGAAALLMAIFEPAYAGLPDPMERVLRTARILGLLGAYPTTIFIGIPGYLMLRRHLAPTALNCSLGGAAIAALPWTLLILLPSGVSDASIGGRATVIDGHNTLYGWVTDVEFVLEIAAFGAAGGLVFWLIAAAGHLTPKDGVHKRGQSL